MNVALTCYGLLTRMTLDEKVAPPMCLADGKADMENGHGAWGQAMTKLLDLSHRKFAQGNASIYWLSGQFSNSFGIGKSSRAAFLKGKATGPPCLPLHQLENCYIPPKDSLPAGAPASSPGSRGIK